MSDLTSLYLEHAKVGYAPSSKRYYVYSEPYSKYMHHDGSFHDWGPMMNTPDWPGWFTTKSAATLALSEARKRAAEADVPVSPFHAAADIEAATPITISQPPTLASRMEELERELGDVSRSLAVCRQEAMSLWTTRDRLVQAIRTHRDQKADDRCIEDDDRLYEALGDGIKCDRRVGDKTAMLINCARFIEKRCEGGGWPSYAELESELARIATDYDRGFNDAVVGIHYDHSGGQWYARGYGRIAPLKELRQRLDAAEAVLADERRYRTYYQEIVYQCCNIVDFHNGMKPGSGIVCGTADHPTAGLQSALEVILKSRIARAEADPVAPQIDTKY